MGRYHDNELIKYLVLQPFFFPFSLVFAFSDYDATSVLCVNLLLYHALFDVVLLYCYSWVLKLATLYQEYSIKKLLDIYY